MRLPSTAHTLRPWLVHQLAPDFHLEDVWALPTPGGPHELPRLVSTVFSSEFPHGAPRVVRALWQVRWTLGALLGWDDEDTGVGTGVRSLLKANSPRSVPALADSSSTRDVYSLKTSYFCVRVECCRRKTVSGLNRCGEPSRRHWYSPPVHSRSCARTASSSG